MKKQIDIFLEKIRKRYKVVVLENDLFLEKIAVKAPLWYFVSWLLASFLILFILITLLIRYTPISAYIIGDENLNDRKELVEAYTRIDSLSQIVNDNVVYLDNIKGVLEGTVGETEKEALERDQSQAIESLAKTTDPTPSVDEKVLLDLLASNGGIQNREKIVSERGISSYAFHSPVRGFVSGHYEAKSLHFATDIATKLNEPIKATLDGHVIFASYTPSTGYVIILQHLDNLLSVYKHCAVLLKKEGSFVRGGEVIAMVGNTGELSTGPHLHFELWNHGNPVDPENYIMF